MFGQLFDGNKDRNTIVYQTLSQPIRARYVRILPEAWHNHISMRMELYGCSGICFKKLPQDCSFRGLHTTMEFQVMQSSNPNCSESCRDQVQFKIKMYRNLDQLVFGTFLFANSLHASSGGGSGQVFCLEVESHQFEVE